MATIMEEAASIDAGAYGVNYALRPHKFIDRRIFIESISRCSKHVSLDDYVYVGLGSFAMEDHKLINTSFGIKKLLSLEINEDVVERQKFNVPLSCIVPTAHSTDDFIVRKTSILRKIGAAPSANLIVWFDMTDAVTLRAHLDTFRSLLETSTERDIIRYTVDIDPKTLGKKPTDETLTERHRRWYEALRELLGDEFDQAMRPASLGRPLGIAKLVVAAFRIIAEEALARRSVVFEPISLTSYADGHRMLSITGIVVERDNVESCRATIDADGMPGGTSSWDGLTNIQIPQLTVWERLYLDREIGRKSVKKIAKELNFRFHETVDTADLLEGYAKFQRFYPNFRHVLL